MKLSDVLTLIMIAVVVFDVCYMRVEIRKLTNFKLVPKLDPLTIEIKCDSADAVAKLEQIKALAQDAEDHIAKLNGLTQSPPPSPEDVDGLLKKSL